MRHQKHVYKRINNNDCKVVPLQTSNRIYKRSRLLVDTRSPVSKELGLLVILKKAVRRYTFIRYDRNVSLKIIYELRVRARVLKMYDYKHFILVFLVVINTVNCDKFKVIREWYYLNFTWPSGDAYRDAISKGLYVPENNIIAGIKQFGDSFYVTLPRMKHGVPATLARIPSGIVQDTTPSFTPFPSWEMNSLGDCNALQNVQNVEIDTKGQIWIIDSGRTETLSAVPSVRCPPKLIIFDIKKNMTTTAYTFPDSVASFNANFLYDIVVDETDGGYAYITDNSARDPGNVSKLFYKV